LHFAFWRSFYYYNSKTYAEIFRIKKSYAMNFDARTAKALTPGQHINITDYPGLRLAASVKVRTWIYRYKSPVDRRMRQTAIGHWPAMSFPAAIVAWE
jgi:hypothetical protein